MRLGGRARGAPRGPPASEAARLVAPRHVALRWKESTDRWRRGCRSSGACEVEVGIPQAITRSAALGGGLRTAAPRAGFGQQDDRGTPGGMAAGCLPTLALDADTATMAGREQEGRPRTARRCRCDHSHSAIEVRPCWRGRRPDFRVCDAAHLQPSGRAAWHDTQIQR